MTQMSEVRYSNLTLAPRTKRKGRPISDRAFASLDFEAWEPIGNNEPTPSSSMMDHIIVQSRLAHVIMLKSKNELIAMFRQPEMDVDTADEMMGDLLDAGERLKELTAMVEEAYRRMQVAGTSYTLA
jgi:hypothetical protein